MIENEAQLAAKEAARKLIHAYHSVFGVGKVQTPQQIAVMDDMRRRARIDSPIFLIQGDGQLDPLKAAVAEGGRLFFLQILEILKTNPEEPKPAPKVSR